MHYFGNQRPSFCVCTCMSDGSGMCSKLFSRLHTNHVAGKWVSMVFSTFNSIPTPKIWVLVYRPDASLTCTTQVRSMVKFLSTRIFHIIIITLREEKLGRTISNSKVFESKWNMVMVWREIFLKKNIDLDFSQLWRCIYIYRYI